MIEYCIQDTVVTAAVYKHQEKFAKENIQSIAFETKVASIISQQVENGFGFDLDKAASLEQQLLLEKAGIEDEMRSIFPDKIEERFSEKTGKRLKDKITVFNPSSRQQIADRLSEKYGWKPDSTEKGNYKVDRDALAKLEYPEAKTLVKYFDSTKLMSQVSDWILRARCARDKRIHGSLNTLGAVTGRMTSSNPNMQQVSGDKRARSLFVPRDGWVMVGADLSGLELRMLAHYLFKYDKGAYAKQILEGDIHTHNQNAMGLDTRAKAKSAIFCFLYGGGDTKFGSVIGTSASKAKKVKQDLLSNIPGLRQVLKDCEFSAHLSGMVRPLGWREIPVRSPHAALNTLLQSSGALVAKMWTCFCDQRLNRLFPNKWRWLANVHDELQLECHPSIAAELGKEVCQCSIKAGEFFGCNIPIHSEFRIGRNWAETH
jgi:DNA polymerase I-like protein with 3'-5' exonuclease and polymerase domains